MSHNPRTDPHAPSSARRRGSALVIVLGLLSILMLMAVAFAIAMRTERGGASNLRHAVVARQMLDTALARVIADLDDELAGLNEPVFDDDDPDRHRTLTFPALPVPDWLVYISTNRHVSAVSGTASVLSYEAAQHLPPDLLQLARDSRPEWLAITGGTSDNSLDDVILGRYAYLVINQTGYLDANLVAATNRLHGLASDEIRIWDDPSNRGLSLFASGAAAADFVSRRTDDHGRYESVGELFRLTRKTHPDGSANTDGTIDYTGRPSTFAVTSLALDGFGPIEPGSVTDENIYGVRPRKFHISPGSLDNYSQALGQSLITAFERAFKDWNKGWVNPDHDADSVGPWAGANSGTPSSAVPGAPHVIPYAHTAAVALLDYVDDDFLPGRNSSGQPYLAGITPTVDWSDRPCTEAVPMLCHFLFFQPPNRHWTEQREPADMTLPAVSYTVTIPLVFYAQSVFINRTIPEQVDGVSFDVSYGTIGYDIEDTAPFNGKDMMEQSLRSSLSRMLVGSHTHTPSLSQRFEPGEEVVVDIVLEYPADEHPPPDEFTVTWRVGAEVMQGGSSIQKVPGQTLQNDNQFLSIDLHLRRNELQPQDPPRPAGDVNIVGWAYVADPRYAYETSDEIMVWMTSRIAKQIVDHLDEEPHCPTTSPELGAWCKHMLEYAPTAPNHGTASHVNPFAQFLLQEGNPKTFDALNLNFGDWPDGLWSNTQAIDDFQDAALSYVPNAYPRSVGELGSLTLAPLRTVTLFDHRHPHPPPHPRRGSWIPVIPRHRVLDWFTVHAPRTTADTPGVPHRTAWLDGRVNLNPPLRGPYSAAHEAFFIEPLTAVLAGLPLNEHATAGNQRPLQWDVAERLARSFVYDNYDQRLWSYYRPHPYRGSTFCTNDCECDNCNIENYNTFGLAYDLSILGRRNRQIQYELVKDWIDIAMGLPDGQRPRSDFEREALIRNSVELLTTRQQVFTIVLKADAFSPEFGFDEAGRGTTLATAHAIVEIWRDPEPYRDAMGRPVWLTDGSGQPIQRSGRYVAPHSWFVRFLRQF